MPRARKVLNAFPADEVSEITGLSRHMIDYLAREGFLAPAYGGRTRTRGKVRYYSYRDLVVARLIQHLRSTGVELKRLKQGIQLLNKDLSWLDLPDDPARRAAWLLSDGNRVFIRNQDGFLDEVSKGQRAFAFMVNIEGLAAEVKGRVPEPKLAHWSMRNTRPRFEKKRQLGS